MAKLLSSEHYSPSYNRLKSVYGSASAIRAEYRRVYAVIEKRWWRAMQAGFGAREVTKAMGSLKPISQIESNSELSRSLSRAYKMLTNEAYTMKGQIESRKRATETMIKKKQLYEGASWSDVDLLFETARKRGLVKLYGSDQIQAIYRERQTNRRKKSVGLSKRSIRRDLQKFQEQMSEDEEAFKSVQRV